MRAAIVGGVEGAAAWSEWFEGAPSAFDELDQASRRLLPLVFRALRRSGEEFPGSELLAVCYRESWYAHNRLLSRVTSAISALQDAGHEVLVIKGVSLAERYYQDRGARSIGDVDIVVRHGAAADALEVLLRDGWRGTDGAISAQELLRRSHAVGLTSPHGGSIDLHRRLVYLSGDGLDDAVWDRAVATRLDGITVLTPSVADELLVCLVHGWAWCRVSSIRWIADVAAIEPHMERDDWCQLIEEARRRQVSYRVWMALREVDSSQGVPVPAWVLERLAGGPFARFEKREERWHLTAHGRVPPGVFAFYEHVRNVGSPNGASWWVGFARYYASLVAVPDGTGPVSWVIDKVGRRRGRKR